MILVASNTVSSASGKSLESGLSAVAAYLVSYCQLHPERRVKCV